MCWQQSAHPYDIIYVNDCSSDNTGRLVEQYVTEHNLQNKVKVIHNKKRLGSGIANIYDVIHTYVADDKIVAILDGDDYLPHNNVLLTLEKYYANPSTWMAYSKLEYIPSHQVAGEKYPMLFIKVATLESTSHGLPRSERFEHRCSRKLRKKIFVMAIPL